MNEWPRIILSIAAAFIYTCLIGCKMLDIAKYEKAVKEKSGDNEPLLKEDRHILLFDIIRLSLDGAILIGFLTSPLCPAWFGLFTDTTLGYCTGCFELISITLLISAFVDWFPYRRSLHHSVDGKTSFSRFLLRQIVNICRIEFALALVWGVFLILEPTKTILVVKIGLSALILLLLRAVLRLARGRKEQKPENPD